MGRLNANASPSNPQPPQEEYQLQYQQQKNENDTFPDDHLPPSPPYDTYYTVEDVQDPPPPPTQQQPQALPIQPVLYPQQSPHMVPSRSYTPASQPNFQQQQAVVQFPPQPVKYPPQNFVGQAGYQQPMHNSGNNLGTPMGTPVSSQYPMVNQVGTEGWKTGLFDCMDDPGNAILVVFCFMKVTEYDATPQNLNFCYVSALVTVCFPCVTYGQVAEIIDNGHTTCATSGLLYGLIACLVGLPCLISCTYRTKLRSRYGLVESPGPDWLIHCFCEWCALCQEYRELQHRGMDPSIGN
ncbi:hypothetical protein RJ639_015518 [Escallonia herrerae]|uniref:Uncharacterized protein n=1 Tax=Escallonia herrerae TaxID=1293975 RepID=A0AA88VDK3_9ASTE|nr:hypothetical protein RJ639_015518 [Escallonia herrerae]